MEHTEFPEPMQTGSLKPEQVEPSELHQRLQSNNLNLFGGDNDCVWVTIAHLLNMTIEELKLKTGLSPTAGIAGIHENAVQGLLTSLGIEFWASPVEGLAATTIHRTDGPPLGNFEDVVSNEFPGLRQGLGVCYTRSAKAGEVATGHCVVYEPTYTAQTATYHPHIGFLPSSDERRKGPMFRFVDYSINPASDALWDVKESRIKFVFGIHSSRRGARFIPSEMQEKRREERSRREAEYRVAIRKWEYEERQRIRRGLTVPAPKPTPPRYNPF